jgi:hypothetical protein
LLFCEEFELELLELLLDEFELELLDEFELELLDELLDELLLELPAATATGRSAVLTASAADAAGAAPTATMSPAALSRVTRDFHMRPPPRGGIVDAADPGDHL